MNLPDAPIRPENIAEEIELIAQVLAELTERVEQIKAALNLTEES